MIRISIFLLYIFLFHGCYSYIGDFKSIGQNSNYNAKENNTRLPIIFFKECSKSGYTWLYDCQVRALDSIFESIKLHNKSIEEIQNIQIYYFPKKYYIKIEIYDERLLF